MRWRREAVAWSRRANRAARRSARRCASSCCIRTMAHESEALLMFAARREHVDRRDPARARRAATGSSAIASPMRPTLTRAAGTAFRSSASTHSSGWLHADCQPDLTLLFDVPAAVSRERLDRLSARGHRARQVRARGSRDSSIACASVYLARAAADPRRFRIIDSHASAGRRPRGPRDASSTRYELARGTTPMADAETIATRPSSPLCRGSARR